jgi:hypothetical protein
MAAQNIEPQARISPVRDEELSQRLRRLAKQGALSMNALIDNIPGHEAGLFKAVSKDRKDSITTVRPLALAFTQWFDDEDELYWQATWTANYVGLNAFADENYENVAAVIRQLSDPASDMPSVPHCLIGAREGMFAPAGKDRKDPITAAQPMTFGFSHQFTDEGILYWQIEWTTDCSDSHAYADEDYRNVAAVMCQPTGRGSWRLPNSGFAGFVQRLAGKPAGTS